MRSYPMVYKPFHHTKLNPPYQLDLAGFFVYRIIYSAHGEFLSLTVIMS